MNRPEDCSTCTHTRKPRIPDARYNDLFCERHGHYVALSSRCRDYIPLPIPKLRNQILIKTGLTHNGHMITEEALKDMVERYNGKEINVHRDYIDSAATWLGRIKDLEFDDETKSAMCELEFISAKFIREFIQEAEDVLEFEFLPRVDAKIINGEMTDIRLHSVGLHFKPKLGKNLREKSMDEPDETSVLSEIVAAMSALNMEPEPIPKDQQEPDNNGYLCDIDKWAKHAWEHMLQAFKNYTKEKETE